MNHFIGRRKFVQYGALAFGGLFLPRYAPAAKLSFSTLGCPEWDLPQIIQFARDHGYQGLELRGIKEHMFLPDSPWLGKEKLGATRRMIAGAGLKVVGLGSSAQMHHTDAATADKHLDEARRFIDLAGELGCPNVRVYPEKLPEGAGRQATKDLIVSRLQQVGDYAKGRKVNVLVETHGDLLRAAEVREVMDATNRGNVGLIWDIVNMWVKTKEAPATVYPLLKPYIRHIHLKDMVWEGDDKFRYVRFGQGVAPMQQAIGLLRKGGYKGYYSFEWEKRWHPEIDAPELAIAQFPAAFAAYYAMA